MSSVSGIINWFTKSQDKITFNPSELESKLKAEIIKSLKSALSLRDFGNKLFSALSFISKLHDLPADTRIPTCSLFNHLKNTSAIVTCLAMRNGLSERQISMLRLGALLHDVGKIRFLGKGIEHVEGTITFLESIKSDLLALNKDFFREDDYNVLVKLASRHHTGYIYKKYAPVSELEKLLALADTVASASDRQPDINVRLVNDSGQEVNTFNNASKIVFSTKDMFFPHLLNLKTDQYVISYSTPLEISINDLDPPSRNYLKIGKDLTTLTDIYYYIGEKASISGSIGIIVLDISGIQRFIMSTKKLAGLIGGSLLIQELENGIERIISNHVCSEALLMKGGGNVIAFIPNFKVGESIEKEVSNLINEKFSGALRVAVAIDEVPIVEIMENIGEVLSRIFKEVIPNKKFAPYTKPKPEHIPSNLICTSCHERKIGDDGESCNLCKSKMDVGKQYRYGGKGNSALSEREFIVRDAIKKLRAKYELNLPKELEHIGKNIAVLAIDGNMVGRFFSQISTIPEYSSKSEIVDKTIKAALIDTIRDILENHPDDFINTLTEESDAEDSQQTQSYLGLEVLYVGGDDILIIIKSEVALLFVKTFTEKVYRSFSFRRNLPIKDWNEPRAILTLSTGIAIARHKFPIYFLLDKAFENQKRAKLLFRQNTRLDEYQTHILPHGAVSVTTVYNAMPSVTSHDFLLWFDEKKEVASEFDKIIELVEYSLKKIKKDNDKKLVFPKSLLQMVVSTNSDYLSKLNTLKFLYSRMTDKNTVKQALEFLAEQGINYTPAKLCEFLAEYIIDDRLREPIKDILPVVGD